MPWTLLGILSIVCAVLCAVGFYKFVYFLSIGYGFAVAGEGLYLLLSGNHITTGTLLCCLGGSIGWAVYLLVEHLGGGTAVANLFASMAVAIYANIMSRLRKCPVTPYLVVSYFPLVPGFTLYQTMSYGIGGNLQLFLETFVRTFAIGGSIALGTLIVSTAIRAYQGRKGQRHASL